MDGLYSIIQGWSMLLHVPSVYMLHFFFFLFPWYLHRFGSFFFFYARGGITVGPSSITWVCSVESWRIGCSISSISSIASIASIIASIIARQTV